MNEYNGIKVGDLIKAIPFKGFLEVTSIDRRFYTELDQRIHNRDNDPNSPFIEGKEYNPLFRFEYRYNESGIPIKRKLGSVDASYVILAKDHIEKELKKLNETRDRLNLILNNEL